MKKTMKSRESYQRINFPLIGHYTHGGHDLMKKYIVLQTKKLLGIIHITYGLNPVRYLNIYLKVAGLTPQHVEFARKRSVCPATIPNFQNLFPGTQITQL